MKKNKHGTKNHPAPLKKGKLKLLPGYPRREIFTRIEDVKAYLDGDKITCLLCGKECITLGSHLAHIHDMSNDDYRVHFGIPFSYGLAGKNFRANSSRRLRRWRKEGKVPHSPSPAHIRKLLLASKKRRRPMAATLNESMEKILRLHHKKKAWQPEDFEAFLQRIQSGKTASEVGREKNMPSRIAFHKHMSHNPELKKRYDEVWETLPFSVQSRANKTGELYRRTLTRLRQSGKTWKQVAEVMQVDASVVSNMWYLLKRSGRLKKYLNKA